MSAVTLDREQREALRAEIGLCADLAEDVPLAIAQGDRAATLDILHRLQGMTALLDALGWSEPDDAPDQREITLSAEAAAWAILARASLARSLSETSVRDVDLVALGALTALAPR